MKNMLKIILILIVAIMIVSIAFASLYPMDFYSLVFLTWVLIDPEPCGKFMAETVYMLVQMDHLKNIMTEDEWNEVQEYFDKKRTESKRSAITFDCINVVENHYVLPLWPDMQKKALEIWKEDYGQ